MLRRIERLMRVRSPLSRPSILEQRLRRDALSLAIGAIGMQQCALSGEFPEPSNTADDLHQRGSEAQVALHLQRSS